MAHTIDRRHQSPLAFAERIVAAHILRVSNPRALLDNEDVMSQACELVAKIGAKNKHILSPNAQSALDRDLKAALSPELYERYSDAEDGHTADMVAHLEAGLTLGVVIGRMAPKGGAR